MIIDEIYPTGHGYYATPSIYMRTRNIDGELSTTTINPQDEDYTRPFCWIPVATSPRRLSRLAATVEGVRSQTHMKQNIRGATKYSFKDSLRSVVFLSFTLVYGISI